MAKYKLEYLWLDGYTPVPNLRGKTRIKEYTNFPTLDQLPLWGFDGSSTKQAEGRSWTLLRTSPFVGISDSIRLTGSEMNRCAVSLDFLTLTNA